MFKSERQGDFYPKPLRNFNSISEFLGSKLVDSKARKILIFFSFLSSKKFPSSDSDID